MPPIVLPTKPCHNCRKRRWKCDRSLPVCQKCLKSSTECLGYGKLFVWNKGVASRGRMMGKSYNGSQAADPTYAGSKQAILYSNTMQEPIEVSTSRSERLGIPLNVHWPLIDPLVKDLNSNSRYYVYHFATQICEDLVIYDGPGRNPIRDLIPATNAHPALLQIILANSAFHVFNISRDPISQSPYQQKQKPCLVAYYRAVGRFGGPMTSSYSDALLAKQQALSLLAQSIASIDANNIDLVLVVILLFINYDLIESGRDQWKVHIEGARKLINLLSIPPYVQRPMSKLRLSMLADFLVFYILGSTFSVTAVPDLIPDSIDLDAILGYAETNNYLSCPGPLLRVMLQSFALEDTRTFRSDEVTSNVQIQVAVLLRQALSFDPTEWTRTFQPASPTENLEHRKHIAAAHRAAVCIYLVRMLPCTHPLLNPRSNTALVSLTGLADEVVANISHLRPGDTLFKSISWPLFLAGAESEDPAQRDWIMTTLDEFYHLLYWGYVRTVKRVLEAIWKCKDSAEEGADNCWVDEVKELGTGLLIA